MPTPRARRASPASPSDPAPAGAAGAPSRKHVRAFTDGSAIGNPGPGGLGVILEFGKVRREISQGFRNTTNNRMELTAAIRALEALKEPCDVHLVSDSRYLVDAFEKSWLVRWQRNGWVTTTKKPVENSDLWRRLLELTAIHRVRFAWERAHAGHPQNERCDHLARTAAKTEATEIDAGYERG